MDKEKQYEKTMKYYKMLLATIEKNKKEKKHQPGHLIFNLSSNPIWDGVSTFAITIGLSFVLAIFAKLPAYFAIPIAGASACTTGMLIPLALHKIFMHSKHKIGRGYAKMELDSYFDSLKGYTKENLKNLINSKSHDDVTEAELEAFANVFGNVTENYKTTLDKYVGKKIYNKVKTDYNKVEKLLAKQTNQEKNRQKIQKIIERNEKALEPWCELYNTCGKTAKNLYEGAHNLNESFEILPDNKFVADNKLLRKKVNQLVMKNAPAKQVNSTVFMKETKIEKTAQKTQTTSVDRKNERLKNFFGQRQHESENMDM